MKGGVRRIILTTALGLLALAVAQVGIYNWRLALSMRQKDLTDQLRELQWRREELLVDRAALTSPARLGDIGELLRLGPLPLDRFSVIVLDIPGGGGETFAFVER